MKIKFDTLCFDRNVQNPQPPLHPRHCDDIGEGSAGGAVSDIGDPVKGQSVPPEPFHLKAPSWQGRSGGQGHENHGDNSGDNDDGKRGFPFCFLLHLEIFRVLEL